MIATLRETCRQLLSDGKVDVVIGYGHDAAADGAEDAPVYPVFITKPEDAGRLVWNDRCHANLAVYLKHEEIRSLGRAAIIVKGCDQRSLVVLEKESQLDRSKIYVIGIACDGLDRPKCRTCDVHEPRGADVIIGHKAAGTGYPCAGGVPSANGTQGLPDTLPDDRYAELRAFLARPSAERLAYWRQELARCVKCYACRQVCPMCYCRRCIVDKNRPQIISTSATLKGNFAWHITRAFHLAGRCVGCEECSRACPMGIDLRLLNLSVAQAAEENFAFRAGDDPAAEPVIGSYAIQDKEDFIR